MKKTSPRGRKSQCGALCAKALGKQHRLILILGHHSTPTRSSWLLQPVLVPTFEAISRVKPRMKGLSLSPYLSYKSIFFKTIFFVNISISMLCRLQKQYNKKQTKLLTFLPHAQNFSIISILSDGFTFLEYTKHCGFQNLCTCFYLNKNDPLYSPLDFHNLGPLLSPRNFASSNTQSFAIIKAQILCN